MELGVLVDVCIGVLAVVVVFSLAASAIQEFWADNILQLRGRTLRRALEGLFERWTPSNGKATVDSFFAHKAMRATMDGKRLPSAIEPRHFAEVARQVLANDAPALANPAAGAGDPLDPLEREFNELMDRVSGWYLRRTRWWLFGIGLLLAFFVNVDIFKYSQDLLRLDDARQKVAAYAAVLGDTEFQKLAGSLLVVAPTGAAAGGNLVSAVPPVDKVELVSGGTAQSGTTGSGAVTPPEPDLGAIQASAEKLDATVVGLFDTFQGLNLSTGWPCEADKATDDVVDVPNFVCEDGSGYRLPNGTKIATWFLIAFAVTLGAQFWFDLFRTLIGLRAAGKTSGKA